MSTAIPVYLFFLDNSYAWHHEVTSDPTLPIEDLDRMVSAYLRTPHPLAAEHPGTFVQSILFRVYTEWCLQHPDNHHVSNRNAGFLEFIDQETHYQLVRDGYRWNETTNSFEGLTPQEYRNTNNRVLDAVVSHALSIDVSSTYHQVGKNLRVSLENHLKH